MARWAGWLRARGWLFAVVGVGCTAPNPSYDGGEPTSNAQDDTGATVGTSAPTTTSGAADATMSAGSSESGSGSGAGSCEVPPDGMSVTVRPTDYSAMELCGLHETRTGRLELFGEQYVLHLADNCVAGSPVTVIFAPKGPNLSGMNFACVSFELGYRDDCTFESATIRDSLSGQLVYAAASVPSSHVPELTLALGDPDGEVCDCQTASCCTDAPAAGLYTVDATTASGESATLGQGGQTMFNSGPDSYELGVPRARATSDCAAPLQVDWYYRRVEGG